MIESRVLLLDIETFPNEGYFWGGLYEQHIIRVTKYWSICCFSAKWLGDKKSITLSLEEATEAQLLQRLWELLDEATVVIAHNGDQFDLPKIHTRFAVNMMLPPSPYQTVDTKKAAKRFFGFTSNSLANLCEQLGIGKKMDTGGFDLWTDCMAGVKRAWQKMRQYNRHDVVLLEGLYLRLRPWIVNHPNVSPRLDACPKCASGQLQRRGYTRSLTRVYQRWQCQSCGGWTRSTRAEALPKLSNI